MNGIPAGELVDTGSNNGNCTSSWTLPTLPPAMASSTATSSVGSTIAGGGSSCIHYSHGHSWNQGQDGNLEITFPDAVTNWEIVLKFDKPVNTLSFYQGQVTKIDDTTFSVKNQNYNGVQSAGGKVSSGWQALFADTSDPPKLISAEAQNFNCEDTEMSSSESTSSITATSEEVKSTISTTEESTIAASTESTIQPTTTPNQTESSENPGTEQTSTSTASQSGSSEAITGSSSNPNSNMSCLTFSHGSSWNQGQDGNLEIIFPDAVASWEILLKFNSPVKTFNFYQGQVNKIDDTTFSVKNQNYNGVQSAGGKVSSGWQALFDETSDPPQMISAEAVNFECGSSGTQPTSTSQPESSENPTTEQTAAMSTTEKPSSIQITSNPSPLSTDNTTENTGSTASSEAPTTAAGNITTKYDYDEVIRLSNLFYQAQRSGELDAYGDFNHNLIPYRGDSSLQDGSDNGVDLTGGYHDGKSIFQFFCN